MTPRASGAGSSARGNTTRARATTGRGANATGGRPDRATAAGRADRATTAGRAGTARPAPEQRRGGTRATVGNTALAPRLTSPAPVGASRRRPALAVVPPMDSPAPRTPFVFLILVLVAAGLVGLLLLNTAINENAFRLHDLQKEQEALDLREQQLDRDIERLEAPGTLQAAARRLGLVPGGNPAYIYLPSGQVVGVPTPGRAAAPPPSRPKQQATPNSGAQTKPGGQTKPGTPANQGAQSKPGTPAGTSGAGR
jgi:hypothetical protein